MGWWEAVLVQIRRWFGPPEPPDPREQLEALLKRLRQELREAKIRAADMIRVEKKVRQELDEYRFQAFQAEEAARAALQTGQEVLARRYLEKKLHADEVAQQLEEQRAAIAQQVERIREAIETYELEIDRLEREQRTWELRERTARLRAELPKHVPSTALAEARTLLEATRELALRQEARAEVRQTLSRSEEWQQRLRTRSNPRLEQEIQRLREQLSDQ